MENYAGCTDKDNEIKEELERAGITAKSYEFLRDKGEVKTSVVGELFGWIFQRAWYYWTATGPGIPPNYATPFNKIHGDVVRVEGMAGGVDPIEYNKGFAVGCYHIDTQEGLDAFAELLLTIVDESNK